MFQQGYFAKLESNKINLEILVATNSPSDWLRQEICWVSFGFFEFSVKKFTDEELFSLEGV